MNGYILPGISGLLLGLTLRWTRLCCPAALQTALALRVSHTLRSLLYCLGAAMALTALLMWLAVIDVDEVAVAPLSAGTLLGGAVFGIAVALAGFTPLTAFSGVGSGTPLPALCTIAGCLLGTWMLPLLEKPLSALQALPPHSATTLFRTTLDEPYLLGGSFLAQGCAGALLMAIAACIPSNRHGAAAAITADAAPAEAAADMPEALEPDAVTGPLLLLPAPQEDPAPPQSTPEDAFIALLPGEEPLVVDTALDGDTDENGEDPDDQEDDEESP